MDTETTVVAGAGARLLRELIRTPKFREAMLLLLNSIDPPATRQLVRTFFWEDAVLFMSVLGAVPAIVNVCINVLAEALAQAGALPAPLLRDFIDQVVAGLDGAALGEAAAGGVSLLGSVLAGEGSSPMEGASKLGDDFKKAYQAAGGEESSTAGTLLKVAGEAIVANPDIMENVVRPLLGPAVSEIFREQTARSTDTEGG